MGGIAAGIVLLAASSIVASLLALEWRSDHRLRLFSILLFSGAVVFYIRTGFGRYFTTIDESYYVSLLGNAAWYRTSIVSGYVTPFLLHLFRPLFSTPVDEVIWYSVTAAAVYVVSLFLVYRTAGLSPRHSAVPTLVLLMTPLYMWSVIQVRPQQIGLLVGLFITALFVRMKPNWRLVLAAVPLYILLVFSHVLSFIVYSLLLLSYLSLLVLFRGREEYLKKYPILAGSIVLSWVVFIAFPYSGPILGNMTWLFNNLLHTEVSRGVFSLISTGTAVILLLGWYIVLDRLSGYFEGSSSSLDPLLKGAAHLYRRTGPRLLLLVGVLIVLGVAYVQFTLGAKVYTRVYQGSALALLLFQMGNLMFALLYLRGVFLSLWEKRFDDLELLSLLMLPIAGAFLLLSFFMPKGNGIWGFHNWFIRGLQYFVPLSAPLVARQLLNDADSSRTGWERALVSVFVALLITISVLNTARVPGVYDYDAVWSHELVELCRDFDGIYVPRGEPSLYSSFVANNLLKACGGALSKEYRGSFTVSSDGFYVHSNPYSSLTIGAFSEISFEPGVRLVVMAGGDALRSPYVVSMLGSAAFVHLNPGENCPLERSWLNRPVLLIGGPVSNPCTRELEESGALDVKLGSTYVKTPRSTYSVPSPDEWWDVREGLFVVYSLQYRGSPVMLVEGTNLDATLAGVYYLVNEVYLGAGDYDDVRYIVGRWEEMDGDVVDAAKGIPTDTNGFSPGDRITVLERG